MKGLAAASGLSRDSAARNAFRAAAREARDRLGAPAASAAIVFCTPHHLPNAGEGVRIVAETAGTSSVAGCVGGGVLTEEGEVEGSPAVAVLVIGGEGVEAAPAVVHEGGESAGCALAEALASRVRLPRIVAVFPEPSSFEGDSFLEGLAGVPLVGGVAAGPGVFAEDAAYPAGASAIALGGPFSVETLATHCAEPLGPARLITDAAGNRILQLDGMTPVELLQNALSLMPTASRGAVARSLLAGIAPIVRKPELERGDFIVRNILDLDPQTGSIGVGMCVAPGMKFAFHVRDAGVAETDLRERLERARSRMGTRRPAFGLYLNCAGRGAGLYGRENVDVSIIGEILGSFPLCGFHGNGEIATAEGRTVLHNYTGVLALFLDETHGTGHPLIQNCP